MKASPFRRALLGGAAWLLVSLVVGWNAVHWAGSRGSVLQLLTGAAVGAFGALAHAVVCLTSRFRASGVLRRALVTWLLAYLPFLTLAVLLFDPVKTARWDPHFWRMFSMYLGPYTGLPMALMAFLVALFTRTPAGGAGNGRSMERTAPVRNGGGEAAASTCPETRKDLAEHVRAALLDAALRAHEEAGVRGLCAEGRWEAAVDAMRSLDLGQPADLRQEPDAGAPARPLR